MSCVKTFNLNPKNGGDTSLTQAIYSASQDAIYGVNGQWIYKFNATTGAKIKEYRFRKDVIFSESYIVEVGSSLYVGTWRSAIADANTIIYPDGQDIFVINYALTSAVKLSVQGSAGGHFNSYQSLTYMPGGFANLCTDGTVIYGNYGVGAANIFGLNPTDGPAFAGAVRHAFGVSLNAPVSDMAVDAANGVIWLTGTNTSRVYCIPNTLVTGDSARADNDVDRSLGVCIVPNAVPASVKVYFATASQTIKKADVATAYSALPTLTDFTLSDISLIDSDAQPMRLRYCAHDGLIYIPTWSHDTVEILNPATDVVNPTPKTGFNNPIDCVFQTVSPFKKWAVQWSSVGLREII